MPSMQIMNSRNHPKPPKAKIKGPTVQSHILEDTQQIGGGHPRQVHNGPGKKALPALLLLLCIHFPAIQATAAATPAKQAGDAGNKHTYVIEINIPQCRLSAYELVGDKKVLISTHKVATAKKGLKKYPKGMGMITKVEVPPYWHPTAYTRRYFAEKGIDLPKVVPPHHKLNYLGDFRARLSHTVPGKGQIYCIHGNNDPTKLGKRATGGCIRMDNQEGIELIERNILKPGTTVYITDGTTASP